MVTPHVSCPLCAGEGRLWLRIPGDFARPQDRTLYHLLWCDACRYGWMAPRPTPEQVATFYHLESYYTHRRTSDSTRATRKLGEKLRVHAAWRRDQGESLIDDLLSPRWGSGLDICDIGCGSGDNLARLRESGHRVVGVELDPAALAVAKGRGVEVHLGSAELLPQAVTQRRFDIVSMCHVLEHTLDPIAAVRAALSLLKPGGAFVCEVPNNASLSMQRAGIAWPFLDVPRHINFFTPASLAAVCAKAGMRQDRMEYFGYTRLVEKHWIEAEQARWDFYRQHGPADLPMPPRSSVVRAWSLLAQTAFASGECKYDSVRIVARPAAGRMAILPTPGALTSA